MYSEMVAMRRVRPGRWDWPPSIASSVRMATTEMAAPSTAIQPNNACEARSIRPGYGPSRRLAGDECHRVGPAQLARRGLRDGARSEHDDVARTHIDLGHHFVGDLVLDAAHLGQILVVVGFHCDGEGFA